MRSRSRTPTLSRMVFYSTIPFGILALVAAWFVRDPSHLLNNHVAIHQEKEVLAALENRHHERHELDHPHPPSHSAPAPAGSV